MSSAAVLIGALKVKGFSTHDKACLGRFKLQMPTFYAQHVTNLATYILGHQKIINFPFGTNGKLIIFGVPILNHIIVNISFNTHSRPAARLATAIIKLPYNINFLTKCWHSSD